MGGVCVVCMVSYVRAVLMDVCVCVRVALQHLYETVCERGELSGWRERGGVHGAIPHVTSSLPNTPPHTFLKERGGGHLNMVRGW